MLGLAALNTKLHRPALLVMQKSSEITKAGHEFQALLSDFCRAGCIYPQMEDNLCGTLTIKWIKVFQGYYRLARIGFYSLWNIFS